LEDLHDRVVQEGPDRRQAACMRHGSQGTRAGRPPSSGSRAGLCKSGVEH
jgi:hypothetical protein